VGACTGGGELPGDTSSRSQAASSSGCPGTQSKTSPMTPAAGTAYAFRALFPSARCFAFV